MSSSHVVPCPACDRRVRVILARLAGAAVFASVVACGGIEGQTDDAGAPDASQDAPSDATVDASLDSASSEAGACLVADSSTTCQAEGFACCAGVCVNEDNDPLNCGGCGVRCEAPTSMCRGSCVVPTCAPGCGSGSHCCVVESAGPAQPPACFDGASCPLGCPYCT